MRVVKHEDGFTKLSRLCKECGGEWINSFDADWLAVAKMRRLEAKVERLREENQQLLTALIETLDRLDTMAPQRDKARISNRKP